MLDVNTLNTGDACHTDSVHLSVATLILYNLTETF